MIFAESPCHCSDPVSSADSGSEDASLLFSMEQVPVDISLGLILLFGIHTH